MATGDKGEPLGLFKVAGVCLNFFCHFLCLSIPFVSDVSHCGLLWDSSPFNRHLWPYFSFSLYVFSLFYALFECFTLISSAFFCPIEIVTIPSGSLLYDQLPGAVIMMR